MNLEDLTVPELRKTLSGLKSAKQEVDVSVSEVLAELLSRSELSVEEGHWTDWGHVPS